MMDELNQPEIVENEDGSANDKKPVHALSLQPLMLPSKSRNT